MTKTLELSKKSVKSPDKKEVVWRPLKDIKIDIYVRKELDEDRVMYWALKFEHDPKNVDPIEIAQDISVTDGRHRMAGAELAGETEIATYIFPVNGKVEQLERAFHLNITDGPLPMSKRDVLMTMKQMIDQGMGKNRIIDNISKMYPPSAANKLFDEARHGIYRDNIARAKRAVHEGELRLPEAAEKYKIDIEKLRVEMGGKKTKGKINAAELKKLLNTQFRSQGQRMSKLINKAFERYEEGDMTKDQVMEVLNYFDENVKRQKRNVTDWINRFENRK